MCYIRLIRFFKLDTSQCSIDLLAFLDVAQSWGSTLTNPNPNPSPIELPQSYYYTKWSKMGTATSAHRGPLKQY